MGETVSVEEIESVLKPELAAADIVRVGGINVEIRPLKRRWQALFRRAALPMFRAELAATEEVVKSFQAGTMDLKNLSTTIVDSEIEADDALDRAAAVVLASQIVGAEKDPETNINNRIEWLNDNSVTSEMRLLVERQAQKERLVESVGEKLPARLAMFARLAGQKDVTEETVRRLLSSFSSSLPAATSTGSGS